MTSVQAGGLLFVAMIALMALRVPIAIAMFVPGALGFAFLANEAALLNQLKGSVYGRLSLYDLSVIPLFLLMGQFATQGGLSRDLFRFGNAMLGHFKGGMAMAAVLACAAFGSVCGSSVATTATIGQAALPEMKRFGYSGRLSTATLAAGGTLGILIPPSVPLVIYAILTEQNIAKIFAAAFVPGIVAAIGYCIAIALYVRFVPNQAPELKRAAWAERKAAIVGVWPIGLIFCIVFGGIYGGFFSPTEGAAVGAASTFFAAILRRELNAEGVRRCFLGTAETTGMIFLIFVGADMMNGALALSQMPAKLSETITGLGWAPLVVISAILLFYVVLGCVMDELSMILLTIPVIFPTVMALAPQLGLSPTEMAIWFGILVLMVVEIGLIAPPVGLNVYVINSLAKDVPMSETYKGVMPFLASDLIRTTLILFFPGICLWLVSVLFK